MTCSDEAPRTIGVQIGASYAVAQTRLAGWGEHVGFERNAVLVNAEKRLGERTSVQLASGAVVSGTIGADPLGPGWLFLTGLSYRVADGRGSAPFVLLSGTVGALSARANEAHFSALDVRGGVTIGKTLAGFASPYVAARVFGGPVYWRGATGTDLYHYQLALGASFSAGPAVVFAEWAFLGERAASAGAGVSF
jgi:hypothetical protein